MAADELLALCQALGRKHPETILPAFLSVGHPTLAEALTKAGQISEQIRVLPLFLFSGKHLNEDIPQIISEFETESGKPVHLLPAIGHHPKFMDLVQSAL